MPSGRPAGRSTAPSGATDGPGTPGRRGREPALWRPTRRRRRQRRSGGRRRDRTAPARGALPGSGRHGPAGIWAAPPEDGAWRVGRDLQPQERREGFVITANAVETAETPKPTLGGGNARPASPTAVGAGSGPPATGRSPPVPPWYGSRSGDAEGDGHAG